jgi:hypothetical protein
MQLKKEFIAQIHTIITAAKDKAIRSVDTESVLMYCKLGRLFLNKNSWERSGRLWGVSYKISFESFATQIWHRLFSSPIGNV